MKTLEDIGLNENVSKQSRNKIVTRQDTYTFNNIKKILLLDNIPKLMSIFGLAGFCVSVVYLLMCPFLFRDRWIIAVFQIIMFGGIYYYGMKKTDTSICCDGV